MNTNEQILNQFKSLENGELSMNMKSINSLLTQLFQNYSLSLNKITGNAVFSNTVVREIQNSNGVSTKYGKGQITFKNSIDRLRYLLNNRRRVANAIGVDATDIYKNRRNLGLVSRYISMMEGKYELGNPEVNMQMYISKYDGNVQPLDSTYDWVDYILTQDWVDSFAQRTTGAIVDDETDLSPLDDFRLEYLADVVQEMMADHEADYHKDLEDFKPDDFLSIPRTKYEATYAKNKIGSLRALEYGFYEMFKPIGGTTDKYIKVKLSTNGILDISGVIGLSDCTKVDWNYGSRAYLRSLNTGNERYDFKLSIPFNDENSTLWWKPDEKERISDSPSGNPRYRYYRPYETERFLRWFGTSYIPLFDMDTIVKKTVCSAPKVENQRGEISLKFSDATQLLEPQQLPSAASADATSSGLSLSPIATIDLIQKDDGQYLRFIVSGNRGTQNLSFNIRGRIFQTVQEMNHYGNTWKTIKETYLLIQKHAMFLEITRQMNKNLDEAWNLTYPELPYIPKSWDEISTQIQEFLTPNYIDLTRLRNIDFSSMMYEVLANTAVRIDFIKNIKKVSEYGDDEFNESNSSLAKALRNNNAKNQVGKLVQNTQYYDENLYNAIMEFDPKKNSIKDMENLPEEMRTELLETLTVLSSLDDGPYEISYDDITVEELRKRIKTFNTLITRLPTDTVDEKISSRNIFMDWKKFVDDATKYLVKEEMLFVVYEVDGMGDRIKDENGEDIWAVEYGVGTDGREHPYTEVYIDPTRSIPLVDYSYCKDADGNIIHDRFDYWTVDDFR